MIIINNTLCYILLTQRLESFHVNCPRSTFIILPLRDPHLLEGVQGSQDGATEIRGSRERERERERVRIEGCEPQIEVKELQTTVCVCVCVCVLCVVCC